MRKILTLIGTFLLFSSLAFGTSFVQTNAGAIASSANQGSVSFNANVTPGDLIIIGLDFASSSSFSSIGDSQGNVFTQIGTQLTTPGGGTSRLYYAHSSFGGPDTVTVKLTASSPYLEIYATEYASINTNNPIDTQSSASGTATSVSSGMVATRFNNEIIYGFCVADSACTAGLNFNTRSSFHSNLIEDETVNTPGNYSATGTANSGWSMHMVAFTPSSGKTAMASFTITVTGTSTHKVSIGWTNSPTVGVVGYDIFRGTTSNNESPIKINGGPVSIQPFLDLNVTDGVKYFYVLTSVMSNGAQSTKSNEASVTIPSP